MSRAYLDAVDLDVDAIVDAFAPATAVGKATLLDRLKNPLTDRNEIVNRQQELQAIKRACRGKEAKITEALAILRETEADVVSVRDAASDERLKEYYTQIMWDQKSVAARLNHLGWLNEIIVFLRTILLPGLSVLLPIFIFVAPLILYTMVLKEPITFSKYIEIIQGAIKQAVPSVLGAQRFKGAGGLAETGEQFLHIGIAVAMLGASIWNQVSAALHMRSIVADMRRRATAVQNFTEAVRNLSALTGITVDCGSSWSMGPLGIFGDAWNGPDRVAVVLAAAGHLDMLVSVATRKKTCTTVFDISGFNLTDLYHPGVAKDKRIMNSVTMTDRTHVLLTGPNRGGKSTLLKSVGYAVLMSQSLGVVFARRATLPVFDSIITALTPMDVVGKLSLFEAEIEFAKTVLGRLGVGKTFLMMDEIFHGTNAHDGVEAAQVFLDRVYGAANTYSIVSTHYMALPEKYGKDGTLNLCMGASVDQADPDSLVYTYKLAPGINHHSSVREILRERGLLR
jgi:hypothetical protein